MSLSRRDFLASSAAAAALAACGSSSAPSSGKSPTPSPTPVAPPPAKLDLLILGGTGFLGPHVVNAAVARGHTVTMFNRGKTDPHLFPNVETLIGDRDGKLDALRQRRWHGVVDTSGFVPRIVRMSAELLAPNVDVYLFVSSTLAYDPDQESGDESARLLPLEDETSEDVQRSYGPLKAACERVLDLTLPGKACVFRPGHMIGPRDSFNRFTYWLARLAEGGELLAPGDGKDPLQITDARDVAQFMLVALENRLTRPFNIVGPKTELVWSSMLERSAAGIGARARPLWVSSAFLEKHGVFSEGGAAGVKRNDFPLWMPRRPDRPLRGRFPNARAVADGLTFRPLEDTARDTMQWWAELPDDRKKLPSGLPREREAEILAAWKAAAKTR